MATTTKRYTVRIEAKHPGCGERPEYREVEATSAAEAKRVTRRDIERGGYSYRRDGALFITATEGK
jgi:hypothetical protein